MRSFWYNPATMRRSYALAALGLVLLSGCFWRKKELPPFDIEGRRLAIVMPFSYSASDKGYSELPAPFASKLSSALFETKRLRMIDRGRLDTTLTELKLPVGVPLDSSQIATVCKQLKAEVAIYGTILLVEKESEKYKGKVYETLSITAEAKLVQASTAEVLSKGGATGKASVKYKEGSAPPAEVLTNAALQDAAKQVAEQLVSDLTSK